MSALTDRLVLQIRAAQLPAPQREVRVCLDRRWRFDCAWDDLRLAVEVEGGTWIRGRHARGRGMRADCEKYNRVVLDGWTLLRVTTDMVRDGSALTVIESAVRARLPPVPYDEQQTETSRRTCARCGRRADVTGSPPGMVWQCRMCRHHHV